jgi:hypothetical protein
MYLAVLVKRGKRDSLYLDLMFKNHILHVHFGVRWQRFFKLYLIESVTCILHYVLPIKLLGELIINRSDYIKLWNLLK